MQDSIQPAAKHLMLIRDWLQSGVADLRDPQGLLALLTPVCEPDSVLQVLYLEDGTGRQFRMHRTSAGWVGSSEPLVPPLHAEDRLGDFRTAAPPEQARWYGFVTLPGLGRAGLIATLWWPDPASGGIATASFGIAKDDLDRLAGLLPLAEHGVLIITGEADQIFWFSSATGGLFSTATLGELVRSDQPDHVLVSRTLVERNSHGRRPGEIFSFRHQDRRWWAASYRLSEASDEAQMTLLLPDDDLATHLDRVADGFTYALFGLLGLGVLALALIAARYRRRLVALLRRRLPQVESEEELRALIAGGESDRVEFKSTLRTNLATGKPGKEVEMAWLKTVVAFLNSNGGVLLIGIADDGEAVGLEADRFVSEDKFMLHFNNQIRDHVGLDFARYIGAKIVSLDGKRVFAVSCRPAHEPVFLRVGKQESYYVRVGPSSRKLAGSLLLAHLRQE
jgi:hypothetical protein